MNQQDRPYQLVAYCGIDPAPQLADVKLVDLSFGLSTPAEPAEGEIPEHPAVAAMRASALSAADVRSRILFFIDPNLDALRATCAYAALSAFCGRRVDASLGTERHEMHTLDVDARKLPDAGRPEVIPDLAVIGEGSADAPDDAVVTRYAISGWTAEELSQIRWAKRVLLHLPSSPLAAIDAFVRVSAVRARSDAERFPALALQGQVVEADEIRKGAAESRRSQRHDAGSTLAEKSALPAGARDLLAAATVPVEAVMLALGSTTPGEGLWHCPRPKRHSNGDANASMRVERGKSRCFRCDAERVDVIRLVSDSRGWTASESAEWILTEVAPRAAELVETVAHLLPADAES
jgi:hypothetical protein